MPNYQSPLSKPVYRKDISLNKPCKNINCTNSTQYTYCKKCNDQNKNIKDQYMTSICEKCGLRGSGDYKICFSC